MTHAVKFQAQGRRSASDATMNFRKIKRLVAAAALCACLLLFLRISIQQTSSSYSEDSKPNELINSASDRLLSTETQSPTKNDDKLELVVAKLSREDSTWLFKYFPGWVKKVYVVDDLAAALTVPKNKGRESMAYLTYIA